ncbi:MAG: hypothetical protein SGILL_007347, partial [Bacillariaceae sp.]
AAYKLRKAKEQQGEKTDRGNSDGDESSTCSDEDCASKFEDDRSSEDNQETEEKPEKLPSPHRQSLKSTFLQQQKPAFDVSHQRLPTDLELVRDRLRNSRDKCYMVEEGGGAIVLHGYLFIQIISARRLNTGRNSAGCRRACCQLMGGENEPYVSVYAASDKIAKTNTSSHHINPDWKTDFHVPVCHPIKHLTFQVKRRELYNSALIGQTKLPVEELIRFEDAASDEEGSSLKLKRTGVYKVVNLDGDVTRGQLEYWVEFIPNDIVHPLTGLTPVQVPMPGAYFPPRQGNAVKLYVDANDNGTAPVVRYGPNQEMMWQPARYFRDVYDTICNAKKLVYIVGWSVDYTLELLRGDEAKQHGLNKIPGKEAYYSSNLGDLLKQKADEDVRVNILVWDDNTSNAIIGEGVVATRDEELRRYGQNSKINLRLVPMLGRRDNLVRLRL